MSKIQVGKEKKLVYKTLVQIQFYKREKTKEKTHRNLEKDLSNMLFIIFRAQE